MVFCKITHCLLDSAVIINSLKLISEENIDEALHAYLN